MLLGGDDIDGSMQQSGYDFVETRNKLFKAFRQNDFARVKALITLVCDADQSPDNVPKSTLFLKITFWLQCCAREMLRANPCSRSRS